MFLFCLHLGFFSCKLCPFSTCFPLQIHYTSFQTNMKPTNEQDPSVTSLKVDHIWILWTSCTFLVVWLPHFFAHLEPSSWTLHLTLLFKAPKHLLPTNTHSHKVNLEEFYMVENVFSKIFSIKDIFYGSFMRKSCF